MDGWMVSAVALALSLGGSWGLSRYQAGQRDAKIKQLENEIGLLKVKASEQATAKAVGELSERFDRWASRIEGELKRMMRGMVKMAAGQPVKIEELLGDE